MRRTKSVLAAALAGVGLLTSAGVATADAGKSGLERFQTQRLTWKPCGIKALDEAGGQCADVTVPLDYARPRGRTITVAISRLPGTAPERRVMLGNPGGPGGQGIDFMVTIGKTLAPDVRARYDLIGMDPRGIGRSTPVDCHATSGVSLLSAGVDRAGFDAQVRFQADLAKRCAANAGDLIPYISTRNTARDMDVVRAVLGQRKISYFGWSYGTYLGAVYTQMFPRHSDRVVLDSAIDPKTYYVGMSQLMGTPNEAALDEWAAWVAARDKQYHLGGTAKRVRASVEDLQQRVARQPITIGGYRVDQHLLPVLLFIPLADSQGNAGLADDVRALTDAADGKNPPITSGLALALGLIDRPVPANLGSAQPAVFCGDAPAPRDPEWYWRQIQQHRKAQPVFGPLAYAPSACAFWAPPREPRTEVHNSVPALIVQATRDTRTVYESGVALHRAMDRSRLVTLDTRIHVVFGHVANTCVDTTINGYLRDGKLPATDKTCR
ncbi:alpha/beta hydrolase [Actinokineospora enzanensis]|uniref:alpha/beta hydrolase n=1 Tax=Actinokineospora enzanensis TaxID=155975 RepID=UPI000378A043|nr:alpha/beta hydrolase [Actinokineospora enzanensis]